MADFPMLDATLGAAGLTEMKRSGIAAAVGAGLRAACEKARSRG